MPLRVNGKSLDDIVREQQQRQVDTLSWIEQWRRSYKQKNPEIVDRLINACVVESHNAFFSFVSLRRPAQEQSRLMAMLADPQYDDEPHRPAAVKHSLDLDLDMANALGCVISCEHNANLIWQDLTVEERADPARAWEANPAQPDLIGQAWKVWRKEVDLPEDFSPLRVLRWRYTISTYGGWVERGILTK